MKHWLSLFICTLLLVACGTPATVTNTPFPPTPPPTEAPTAIPLIATALPPTETPVVKVELDKPMTTEFDLLNTEVMPSTDEEMVTTGILREGVRQYWQETGLINPDGSINKPENVIPAKPDQWRFNIRTGDPSQNIPGGDFTLGPYRVADDPNLYAPMVDAAFQPTDLLFKVKNKVGEIIGILVTEALYYIDPSGKLAVEPVFFFVDVSKTSNPMMPILFGHEKIDGETVIGFPYVGVEDGEAGQESLISRFIEDKDAYLDEPMQEDREVFARQVDATGNPEGMGNFWWAPIVIAAERQK